MHFGKYGTMTKENKLSNTACVALLFMLCEGFNSWVSESRHSLFWNVMDVWY